MMPKEENNESEASASASHHSTFFLFSLIVALSVKKEETKRCDTDVNVSPLSPSSSYVDANVSSPCHFFLLVIDV